MKVLVGDEFGLIKCIDTDKKLLLSKFGAVSKKNAVIGINNLFHNNNDLLAVSHEQNLYVLNWSKNEIQSKPEFNLNEKTLFTSQVVKRTIDFSRMSIQPGENIPTSFSFWEKEKIFPNIPSYLTYTNDKTHRKNNIESQDRATIEYRVLFVNERFKFNRVQTLGRFNKTLPEEWNEPIRELDDMLNTITKYNKLKPQTIVTKKGNKEFKRELIIQKNETSATIRWDSNVENSEDSIYYLA